MLRKIRVFDLQVGMYVVDTGLSWMDHPYLYCQEGLVSSEEHIRDIRSQGYAEAFIETDLDGLRQGSLRVYDREALDRAVAEALSEDSRQLKSNKKVPLAEELRHAVEVHARCVRTAARAMEDVAAGRPLDARACQEAARDIAASAARNRDAMVCLAMLEEGAEGGYHMRHGVGVSVLAAAFGDYLGLGAPQVADLAVAGLLHDVGKALVPREVLERPGKLTGQEFERIKRHPMESCVAVAGCMKLSRQALRGIAEHHERFDGSGYPKGLKGKDQSFHGRLLAVCDVFDALTQERPYKARLMPDKAMSAVYALRGRDFDTAMLERFVKCVGVYPVGSLVRLTSGEHAVVCESNPATPLRPKVTVVFDQDMNPIHPVRMDISGKEGPAPARPVEVVAVVDHRPHGVLAGEHLAT